MISLVNWTNLLMTIFPALVNAVNTIRADTGKPWEVVATDVISHLDPEQPNSPSLTPSPSPAAGQASPGT